MILGDPYEKVIWPPKGLRTTELEDPVRNKFLRMKDYLVGGLRAEGGAKIWALGKGRFTHREKSVHPQMGTVCP